MLVGLLWLLGRKLGRQRTQRGWAAVLGAGFWLVHPLFVSITLYIVQREAILPATAYVAGRRALIGGHFWRGVRAWHRHAVGHTVQCQRRIDSVARALILKATVLATALLDRRRALNSLRGIVLGIPLAGQLAGISERSSLDLWPAHSDRAAGSD